MYTAVSISDLLKIEDFKEAFGKNDTKTINKILYLMGLDITKGVEEQYVQHRNRANEIVTCVRYVALERTDPHWIKSGHASLEAIIESSNDPDMRAALKGMKREGFTEEAYNTMVTAAIHTNKL